MPSRVPLEPEPLTDEQVEQVNANLPLVRLIANESPYRKLDPDDRFQAGVVGLCRAVQKFRPELGFTIATYARSWILQAIQRAARKAPSLASLSAMAEDTGFEPTERDEPSGLDPEDAKRLTAIVETLPDEYRRPIVDHYWRGKRPRSTVAKRHEAGAMRALKLATWNGRQIPPHPPRWADTNGQELHVTRPSPDDAKALLNIRLEPRFPIQSLSTLSECAHKGPLPAGSRDYCPICHASGMDGIAIPMNVKPLPRDKKKLPPPPPRNENRKQRRRRAHAEKMALSA